MMNKPQIIDLIDKKGNIGNTEAKRTLKLTIHSVKLALSKGEENLLIGFGFYKIYEYSELMEINHKTWATIKTSLKKLSILNLETTCLER